MAQPQRDIIRTPALHFPHPAKLPTMEIGELIIRWTVRLAVVSYAVVLMLAIVRREAPACSRISRWIWMMGCVLFLAHVVSAFAFYHDWSHQHAFDDTQAKTEAAIGLAFGWGIYVNHFFALLWLGDVSWSWLSAESYRNRPWQVTAAIHAFMLFIAINGLMVFKDGVIRWTSLTVLLLLLGAWIGTLTWRRNPSAQLVDATRDETSPT